MQFACNSSRTAVFALSSQRKLVSTFTTGDVRNFHPAARTIGIPAIAPLEYTLAFIAMRHVRVEVAIGARISDCVSHKIEIYIVNK